ncbi:PAS domain S-box protein [Candidatus Methylospira mobilis]|uniref:histidine kinase n=1 Tax=Candidatus Methylospira mobilis TaxID=1808979 RepID=A0A5Q0BER0_9GAMM|nr:PAS domain-containing hybrid sensor histidine kinase/response regulator [Candidatus Methylospira mobilis]QFY42353.1 PAS domain S-box protein [Candidatus Methylospira mobilis]
MPNIAHANGAALYAACHIRRLIAGVVLTNLLVIAAVAFTLYRSLNSLQNHADAAAQNLAAILLILFFPGASYLLTRIWLRQMNAMKKLAQEEERFHTVADYTYDWEYWEGNSHEMLYMSPSCERVTGYAPDEFITTPDLLTRITHPDDKLPMKNHRHDASNKEPGRADFRIIRRDGEIRWIAHCCQPVFGSDGSYRGQRVSNRDVTDHHLFETEINRLAQAVEQNPTGMLITDLQGRLIYTNQAYTQITGHAFVEAYGKTQRELISTDIGDDEFNEIRKRLEAGKQWNGMVQNRHKDGALYWEFISASPIYDDEGNISSFLFLRTDITARKRNEEELRRYKDHLEDEVQQRTADLVLARNAAEAANQAKSVFLANMSHELRTPLNAILGFSGIMRKDPRTPEYQRQNLDIINRSGGHLLTLINDVLEMAKIEAGRVQLENAPFDLGGMVREVTDMMNLRAREKGLRLLIDQSSCFPRYISGDEARLRQVLINLVGNAIKFTHEGGVTIRLGTKSNRISHLIIEVEDSGPGIAAEDQQRIFEPFVQLAERGDNKGTGLGLTITRQFVQLMGGNLSLVSTPGIGTLFHVELPLTEVTKADIAKPKAEKGDVVGLAPGQTEYRILIVEDQVENQLLLVKLLESVGFKVKAADNGEQGVALFQSWRPHFIWMDRQMPVMDGLKAMQIIRALPGGREVKIAAVTASAFKEQRAELLNAGMDDFVRKPYRFNEIYECLSKQLGVKYIYKDIPGTETINVPKLTRESLSILPKALRQELKNALESLESERIALVIEQVASYDTKLQKALARIVENFDYPAIIKVLDTN